MFQNLSEKLERAFKTLKGRATISDINVAQTMKEIRKALISADVDYKTAKSFTDKVREKAIGQKVLTSIEPGQLLTKIMKDELAELMGSQSSDIQIERGLTKILVAGLQGSGKTTFSGKLALFLKNNKKLKPLLVACDVYRPAAIDQLEILSKQVNADFYCERDNKDPVSISKNAIKFSKTNNNNLIIIDTAGRISIDQEMMNEIGEIKKAVSPSETLFVVDDYSLKAPFLSITNGLSKFVLEVDYSKNKIELVDDIPEYKNFEKL